MTLLEREDSFFGRKNNKRLLMGSNADYKDPQSYIYPTDMDNSNCIQILVSSPLVGCFTEFRMDSQSSLLMPAKECQRQQRTYSITELEMCRLAMNITTFSHLLRKVDFDAAVHHLAITLIMRSKTEPATTRIKRL